MSSSPAVASLKDVTRLRTPSNATTINGSPSGSAHSSPHGFSPAVYDHHHAASPHNFSGGGAGFPPRQQLRQTPSPYQPSRASTSIYVDQHPSLNHYHADGTSHSPLGELSSIGPHSGTIDSFQPAFEGTRAISSQGALGGHDPGGSGSPMDGFGPLVTSPFGSGSASRPGGDDAFGGGSHDIVDLSQPDWAHQNPPYGAGGGVSGSLLHRSPYDPPGSASWFATSWPGTAPASTLMYLSRNGQDSPSILDTPGGGSDSLFDSVDAFAGGGKIAGSLAEFASLSFGGPPHSSSQSHQSEQQQQSIHRRPGSLSVDTANGLAGSSSFLGSPASGSSGQQNGQASGPSAVRPVSSHAQQFSQQHHNTQTQQFSHMPFHSHASASPGNGQKSSHNGNGTSGSGSTGSIPISSSSFVDPLLPVLENDSVDPFYGMHSNRPREQHVNPQAFQSSSSSSSPSAFQQGSDMWPHAHLQQQQQFTGHPPQRQRSFSHHPYANATRPRARAQSNASSLVGTPPVPAQQQRPQTVGGADWGFGALETDPAFLSMGGEVGIGMGGGGVMRPQTSDGIPGSVSLRAIVMTVVRRDC